MKKAFIDGHIEEDGEELHLHSGDYLFEDGHSFRAQGDMWIEQEPEYSSYQLMKKLEEILVILKRES